MVPISNEKVALSKPQVLPCQRFCCSVHHLNNNMTHKTKVKSRDRKKQNPKLECGVAATLKVRLAMKGVFRLKEDAKYNRNKHQLPAGAKKLQSGARTTTKRTSSSGHNPLNACQ